MESLALDAIEEVVVSDDDNEEHNDVTMSMVEMINAIESVEGESDDVNIMDL